MTIRFSILFPISSVLGLKDRAGLMDDHAVPCAQRNLNPILAFSWANPVSCGFSENTLIRGNFAIKGRSAGIQFFVIDPIETPFKAYHRFRCLQMPMDRYMSPNLQRIEHPLTACSSVSNSLFISCTSIPILFSQTSCISPLTIKAFSRQTTPLGGTPSG